MKFDLQTIYYIIAFVIMIVGFIAALIARHSKDAKTAQKAQEIADFTAEHLRLLQVVKNCMIDTEDKHNFTAVEKHEYCKAKIIDACINQDIDYTQFDLDEEIANNMEIANNINSTKKNKEV